MLRIGPTHALNELEIYPTFIILELTIYETNLSLQQTENCFVKNQPLLYLVTASYEMT